MSKSLILKIEDNFTGIYILEKSFRNIKFLKQESLEEGINILYDSIRKKEYLDNLSNIINQFGKVGKIIFAIQNEKVIIREYRGICNLKKKDILGYINFEISQDMPVNLFDYVIKYKVLSKTKEKMDLQVILFPKDIRDLCLEISKKLNISRYRLNINFDVLQKLIDLKNIKLACDRCFIIENLREYLILNYIENNKIQTSRTLEKGSNREYIETFLKEDINIFYYGQEDLFLESILINRKKVDKLKLDINKTCLWINETVDNDIQNYITEVGLVL